MRRLLAILILLAGALWAQCPSTDSRVWQGTYASGTTYALNDTLYYAGSAYTSLQASNAGHQPDISGTWWVLVYSSPVNIQPTDCRVGSHIALDYNLAWLRANATGGAVSTVFGRSGTVAAQNGDYTTAQVTESGNLYFTNVRVLAAMAGLYQAPITGAPGTWPSFATVATSGSFNDLSNKPTLASLGGFANPMSAAADFIVGGAAGVPTRFATPGNGTWCFNVSSGATTWVTCPGAGGGISSIGLTAPSWLSVTGSPLTVNGTLAIAAATAQTPHQVIGTCGTATSFGPCALVAADIPAIPESGVTGLATDLAGKQPTITGGTQDQVITGTFGLLGLADCTSTGGIWRYSTTTHASSCHTIVVADLPTGTTSSTVAVGNDTRFPASVTGLRKGAGAGSADTAAVAGTDYQAPLTNPVTGMGTTNVIPKRTGSTTMGDSNITENADGSDTAAKALGGAAPYKPTFNAAGTTTCDLSQSNVCEVDFGAGNTTLAFSNPHYGAPFYLLRSCQDSVGGRSYSAFPATSIGFSQPDTGAGATNCTEQPFTWDGTSYNGGVAATPNSSWHGVSAPEGSAPTGAAGIDLLYALSSTHRFGMILNNGSADVILGAATVDTLTNKTFDTAGSGNSFSINGVAATANTGTGAVVRASSPTFTGTVNGITSSMVGLANVDNTSDINKPISTATQTALNAKQPTISGAPGTWPTLGTASALPVVTVLGNPGTNSNIPTEAAVRAAIGGAGGTTTSEFHLRVGQCTGSTTASLTWDIPPSGATAATAGGCTGTNVNQSWGVFANSGTPSLQSSFNLPQTLTGLADVYVTYSTATSSGTFTPALDVVCTPVNGSATDDPSWSANNFFAPGSQTSSGTANQLGTASATGISWPVACTAGTRAHFRLIRTDTTGTATNANIYEVTIIARRTL